MNTLQQKLNVIESGEQKKAGQADPLEMRGDCLAVSVHVGEVVVTQNYLR